MENNSFKEGILYIVPTPIGNFNDMTFRAIETLKTSNLILAEDTRHSGKLLKHFEIDKPLFSFHQHNEHDKLKLIISKLLEGNIISIVTDAGTPCISDPGFLLVRECHKNNIKVSCLPGSTAFVPAIAMSGLPSDSFVFEGFLPIKKGRKTKLEEISKLNKTIILYESPYKLLKTLSDLKEHLPCHYLFSISREISKIYEETINGNIEFCIQHFSKNNPKGEFVIVFSPIKNNLKNEIEND